MSDAPSADQYIEPPPRGFVPPPASGSDAMGLRSAPPPIPPQQQEDAAPDQVVPPNGAMALPVRNVSIEGGGGNLRSLVMKQWMDAGASPAAAEGIALAIQGESGFDPHSMGDYKDGQPTSFGLYMHHADRAARLHEFAKEQGKSAADPMVQTAFAIHEVNGGDPIATQHWKEIQNAKTPEEAKRLWSQYFERPAGSIRDFVTGVSPFLQQRMDDLTTEGRRLSDEYHSTATELMRQANQAAPGSKERDEAIAKLREREHEYTAKYEAIASHPPAYKPIDAMQNFGSAATILAMLGGLFAHHHLTAALSAAGAAMKAANENNYEKYQIAFKTWEQQSTTAFNMVKLHAEEIREIINDKKMAEDEKNTRLQTMFQAFGMQRQGDLIAHGDKDRVLADMMAIERANNAAAQQKLIIQQAEAARLEAGGMSREEAMRHVGLIPAGGAATESKGREAEVESETKRLDEKFSRENPTATSDEKAEAHHKNALAARSEMALAAARSPTGQLSPESVKLLAHQYEMGDTAVITALPRGGPGRIQVENQIADDMKGLDDGAAKIVMNRLRMAEARSAATTAGRVTMNTEIFATEAEKAGQEVVRTSKLFPRTNFPKVNAALAAWEQNTGDPNIIAFGAALNALRNAYGKMSNPTGTGVHDADKEQFAKTLDRALSQGQIEGGVAQIIREGRIISDAAKEAQVRVLSSIMPQQPGTSPQAPAPPAVAQQPQDSSAGVVIQNGWRYDAKTHQPLGPVQ